MKYNVKPTNKELAMKDSDFIITKTDTKGRIQYANRIFIKFSGYTEAELLGKQHNVVRHPDMPRAIFKLLWETIQSGNELFAFVKNLSKDGSYYWVSANVSPVYNANRILVGYSSVRRKPNSKALVFIKDLYKKMVSVEKQIGSNEGVITSTKLLTDILDEKKMSYEEFIYSLQNNNDTK